MDLARDPAAFTAVAIESDDDVRRPPRKGLHEDSNRGRGFERRGGSRDQCNGGFELPSPTEDDVLRKFETMDEDELIVEEVPVAG